MPLTFRNQASSTLPNLQAPITKHWIHLFFFFSLSPPLFAHFSYLELVSFFWGLRWVDPPGFHPNPHLLFFPLPAGSACSAPLPAPPSPRAPRRPPPPRHPRRRRSGAPGRRPPPGRTSPHLAGFEGRSKEGSSGFC